jgi:hypothetical protein
VQRAKNIHPAIKDNQRTNFARRHDLFVPTPKVSGTLTFDGTSSDEFFLSACPDKVSPGRLFTCALFPCRGIRNERIDVIVITPIPARREDLGYLSTNEAEVIKGSGRGFGKSKTFPRVSL